MAKCEPQYVVVTKQRKKSGCLGSLFHLIGGIFTLGMWPAMVWVWHLIGPKQKTVAKVYGTTPEPAPAPPVAGPSWTGPTDGPATSPYGTGYDAATGRWTPTPGTPGRDVDPYPGDPWGDAPMRRRS